MPGVGKTTFARKWVKAGENRLRISRQEIKEMIGFKNYELIDKLERSLVEKSLESGYDVVIDGTNLFDDDRFNNLFADIEINDMTDVPIETAIAQDKLRPNPKGEETIRYLHNKYIQYRLLKAMP